MTSIPLNNNNNENNNNTENNHGFESEDLDKLAELEEQMDLDDIWRDSWSDEEDEGTKKQKRQLKAVGTVHVCGGGVGLPCNIPYIPCYIPYIPCYLPYIPCYFRDTIVLLYNISWQNHLRLPCYIGTDVLYILNYQACHDRMCI